MFLTNVLMVWMTDGGPRYLAEGQGLVEVSDTSLHINNQIADGSLGFTSLKKIISEIC